MKTMIAHETVAGQTLSRQLRSTIQTHLDAGVTRGMQLYVARDGVPILNESIGARGQDDLPVTNETRFNLFSASKPLTATALHLLAQRGQVSYDDAVVRYLPEFARHGKQGVTLAHLLLHQAGIPDSAQVVPVSAYADFPDAIARICDLAPESAPGEVTAYHVLTAMAVVAEIVQRVSGTGLREFCAAEVFEPLGMSRTTYGLTDDLLDEATDTVAGPPERQAVAVLWRSRDTRLALHPAIGIHSTATDLGLFYQEWLDASRGQGRLLTPATVATVTTVHAHEGGTAAFGYGFIVGAAPGALASRGIACSDATFGHPGMCSTQSYADPVAGLVIVLLANVDPGQDVSDRRFADLCDTIQRGVP